MKDIIIKSSTVKKEGSILAFLFSLAVIINLISIILYDGLWHELITQLPAVFILSFVLYILVLLIRLIIFGIRKAFN